MSIKDELERINEQPAEDIAAAAGIYAETNPPRNLNIALAISGGLTTNIATACDLFYDNDTPSQTVSEAIAKGVAAGSPYASISDILSAVEGKEVVPSNVLLDMVLNFDTTDGNSISVSGLDQNPIQFLRTAYSDDALGITVGDTYVDGLSTTFDYGAQTYTFGDDSTITAVFAWHNENQDLDSLVSIVDHTKTATGSYHVKVEVL